MTVIQGHRRSSCCFHLARLSRTYCFCKFCSWDFFWFSFDLGLNTIDYYNVTQGHQRSYEGRLHFAVSLSHVVFI